MLIWINFVSFAIKYLKKVACFKISFSNRGCTELFTNTKRPGTSLQLAVFVEFFDQVFYFVIWYKLAKFH